MVQLITGTTHSGKTLFAQRCLELHQVPYLSLDHLKMGLIRSGLCPLTPESPTDALTAFLWPVAREMAKTAVENQQHLVVEGCYIPLNFQQDLPEQYREQVRFLCLILHPDYIRSHYGEILKYENAVEHRLPLGEPPSLQELVEENQALLDACAQKNLPHLVIRRDYLGSLQRAVQALTF